MVKADNPRKNPIKPQDGCVPADGSRRLGGFGGGSLTVSVFPIKK